MTIWYNLHFWSKPTELAMLQIVLKGVYATKVQDVTDMDNYHKQGIAWYQFQDAQILRPS